MRLLLIGAPGAGKGTQASVLAEYFEITHISSGDLLRQHIRNGSAIGRAAQSMVKAGDLVPDTLVMDMLRKPVLAASHANGYILDGFPRTVEQAAAAYMVARDLGASVQVAVHINVPSDELVRRLLARSRGDEDTQAVIDHRLQVFRERTLPLLDYYAWREQLITVDGALPIAEVTESLIAPLERFRYANSGDTGPYWEKD